MTPKEIAAAERRVQEASTFSCTRCPGKFSTSDEFHAHREHGECATEAGPGQ